MRAPQERTMRDLYDRTRHKDLALTEEPAKERRGGMGGRADEAGQREVASVIEDKPIIRKRPAPSGSPRVKAESGTCNVCYAPCSSCLHRSLALADSNMDCESSQTCCAKSETKNTLSVRSEKGLHTKGGENEDEYSATSSHASYSENGGNKAITRSAIAADSEVDMPAKRRRLLNHDPRSPRVEYHDDSNSCVTGLSAASKLLLDKRKDKLSTSASSRDLTVEDYKDNNIAGHSRLRKSRVEESTENKRPDVHVMRPSSSDKSVPANSPSIVTKKLLRTQSSVSASQGLSPKRPSHGFGNAQKKLVHQSYEKASLSNKNVDHSLGRKLNPSVIGTDKHGILTSCSTSNINKIKGGSPSKDLENVTPCSRNGSQEHVDIQSNDAAKTNDNDKQDQSQDCSMDISSGRKMNTQNDVMVDCANSEGLIDVNVCDICGDVGREYLLATCTRCFEGAEHTYCMRVKLDKVPDGEWLCEECQLNEDQFITTSNPGASTVNNLDGKNQNSDSMRNLKTLQVVVANLDDEQITRDAPITDHLAGNNRKLHSVSTDPEAQQVKCATPTAERLDAKNKNVGSMSNCKRLQVGTSDMEVRPPTCGTPTAGRLNKNQTSEVLLNRKKLRIATDMESPLSSDGLLSPPKSCKRPAENISSSNPRLFNMGSPRKNDVLSRDNSFKKSSKGSLKSPDNASVKTVQAVKSSMTLSRSYSSGSMFAKAAVPSPQGLLSKQLSFNNSNNESKVKQLAEGVASKLKPVNHSPRDPREKEPIRKFMKSGSSKYEGSVHKDSNSLKQKQSFHLSQNEKPRMLKPMKEKNSLERRASFNIQKPNIPSPPRPDGSMKSGDRKIDQNNPRPGPSILQSRKGSDNIEKKQSSVLSKSEKQGITVHPTSIAVVCAKDAHAARTSDPLLPMENVNKDNTNDCVGEASSTLVKNENEMPTKPEVLSTQFVAITSESDLQVMVPRSVSEDLPPIVGQPHQKILESTGDKPSKSAEAVQASEDIFPESPHGFLMAHNLRPFGNKLDEPNFKHQDFSEQSSTLGNSFRALVIPEQTYIWQGIFEVSRPGKSSEIYDGIQAHLSTGASPKALEAVKQLPQRLQLVEVPQCSSWPLQFKEIKPSEDNIALFFFAKDVESYERAYRKLLENMLVGDLSLTANISGIELLIFSSIKLPEKIQRWNGLLYFWGIFYARKANSSTELLVKGTDHCPLEPTTGPYNKLACSPKVPQSLGIDLNECPDDVFYDPSISLGLEIEKSGASEDQKNKLKHEDENLNASEETAVTRQIVLGSATAVPCEINIPTSSEGGGIGTAGRDNMKEEKSFSQSEAPCYLTQHARAIRSMSGEIFVKKQTLMSYAEVSLQHSSGTKLSDDPSELIPKADFVLLDSGSSYKRENTSNGKHSTRNFGDGQLPSKCLSKTHSLPAGRHTPLDDVQYFYSGLADPGSPTRPISDHVIHVLSSDDEDSPEPSTSLNKASLKAEESSSSLLSLSLSTAAKKNGLAGSGTGDDGLLSLSLGLPGVVKGNQALEMKQFLPEKPGINTSFLL